jgi:hypothetical protein
MVLTLLLAKKTTDALNKEEAGGAHDATAQENEQHRETD